jgi:hypothetical protein
MSTLTIIIIIGVTASFVTSTLTIAAAMLSSRISQQEFATEHYDQVVDAPHGLPSPYSMRS